MGGLVQEVYRDMMCPSVTENAAQEGFQSQGKSGRLSQDDWTWMPYMDGRVGG